MWDKVTEKILVNITLSALLGTLLDLKDAKCKLINNRTSGLLIYLKHNDQQEKNNW